MYNGRAIINLKMNGGESMVSIQSQGIHSTLLRVV